MEIYGMTGEKLGTIGDPDREQDVPKWQKDFLEKPSISIRRGISWAYKTAYEDTDTVVLTAPSSHFIDVRLPKSHDWSTALVTNAAFWAFTGISSTTFPGQDEAPMQWVAHSVWKHDIDSKDPGITDEGDLFLLPNGDCVEVGTMKNPASGQVEIYKEYWTSPPPNDEGKVVVQPCVVAETFRADGNQLRGLVIRIGNYCQGIISTRHPGNAHVEAVERWTRSSPNAKWHLDERSCDISKLHTSGKSHISETIPCMWVCDESRQPGDVWGSQHSDVEWKIIESHR